MTTPYDSNWKTISFELQKMIDEDYRLRDELAKDGSLFEGYHPEMEKVHNRNGERLLEIINQYGWPGKSLVGETGARNAWLIAQHAISLPELQRNCLKILKVQANKGEVPLDQIAMLEDRIRIFEGKKQIYGTQFDWDENNQMSPNPIENPEKVDILRKGMGLPPLSETITKQRKLVEESNEKPPKDRLERQKSFEKWSIRVGWQKI